MQLLAACGGGGDAPAAAPGPTPTPQSLIRTSAEPVGAHCANGGTKAQAGLDADGDGVLDTGEVTATAYVCANAGGPPGAATLVRTRAEAAGANCALGGTRLDAGLDADGDGTLDTAEITATTYVCHAAPTPHGNGLLRTAAEPSGANCTHGGTRIEAGLDADGNGALDNAEVQSTAFACNAAPPPYSMGLVRYRAEPAGANCPLGGSRVEAGTDDNGNGVLDNAEVDSVAFICTAAPPGTPYTWRGAELRSVGSQGAGHPRVAMAPGGQGIAAWVQSDGSLWDVRVARYDAAAGTWGGVDVLTPGSTAYPQSLEVAIDPAGNAIVVWTDDHAGALSLRARRYRAAASAWDPAVLLEADDTLPAREPSVAMDAAGNAIVLWSQNDFTVGGAWANRFEAATGAWQGAVRIDDGAGLARRARLAMEPGGQAIAAWEQDSGSGWHVQTSRYAPGPGHWAAPVPVDASLGETSFPQVAINGSGRAVVAFSVGPGDTYASISNAAGTTWNTPAGLETGGGFTLPWGAAIDGFGHATVLWTGGGSARHDGATGIWTVLPVVPSDGAEGRLAMDAAGNILAVWLAGGDVKVFRLAAGAAAWAPPVLMEIDSDFVVDDQSIAVTPDGRAIAGWVQLGGSAVHMLVNVLR